MMRKARAILIVILMFFQLTSHAQDSTRRLSPAAFTQIVKTFHPVIKQAVLRVERSKAELMQSRGLLDPSISANLNQKTFSGKEYFDYNSVQVQIPVWYGFDLKAGMEDVSGYYTDPQLTKGRTSFAGVKFNANSLLIDKRRATILQAKAFQNLSEAERLQTANDVLMESIEAYWAWVEAYKTYHIISEIISNTEQRLRFTIVEYEQGLRPAIDTTETLTQLQSLYTQQNASWLEFQNAGLLLSNYLWLEDASPIQWRDDIVPDNTIDTFEIIKAQTPQLDELLKNATMQHPKLLALASKKQALGIDRRLKAQAFIPSVSINANLITSDYASPIIVEKTHIQNNNKFSIDISVPLFMREARGAVKAAELKLQENDLQLADATQQINSKVKQYHNAVVGLQQQLKTYQDAYNNYRKLYEAEKFRFENGESTLFLLNARENKLIEAAQKLVSLKAKWHKQYAALFWAAGSLHELQ